MQIIKQTNFKMYMHYTVQLYCTLYHKDQSSVSKKTAKEEVGFGDLTIFEKTNWLELGYCRTVSGGCAAVWLSLNNNKN